MDLTTHKKDQLFAIGQMMADAIPSELFVDAGKPFVILVNGDMGCGKSIFSDAMLPLINPVNMDGVPLYAEIWTGNYKNRLFQLGFVNASGEPHEAERFMPKRRCGGITFVQNLHVSDLTELGIPPDLEICMCSLGPLTEEIAGTLRISRMLWNRTIKLSVHNESLLSTPAFAGFLKNLETPDRLPQPDAYIDEIIGNIRHKSLISFMPKPLMHP